jgi:PKHD-type hydroxylase
MNLQHYFWCFESVLPIRLCNEIIAYGKSQQENLALTGGQSNKIKEGKPLSEEDLKDLKKKRDSNVAWLTDEWIYKEIRPYINIANKNANWNFNWDWSEACQFTKYAPGQFYDWHCDSWESTYNEPDNLNTHGKIRKLSVTCSLTDPKDYKGGELEFDLRNNDPDKPNNIITCNQISPRGSIVVFPSHVWHRVKPVTEGIRYSLVIWNIGYPFK